MSAAPPSLCLARKVQVDLERLYAVEAPPVESFVRVANGERETVLVRKTRGSLELRVNLPEQALSHDGSISLDLYCQIVEGVSHFLMLVERARRDLPTTQLELELQAEVDKFVLVKRAAGATADAAVKERLFSNVRFLHKAGSVRGERYRLANQLAARFVTQLSSRPSAPARLHDLRRFFGAGQREKLEMVMAA